MTDEDKELMQYEAAVKGPMALGSITDDVPPEEKGDESVEGNF